MEQRNKELKVQEYLSRNGGRHCISSTQAHVGLRCFFYIKRGIFNSGNLICHLAIVIIFLYISKFYLNYRVRYVVGAVTYFRGVGGREREWVLGKWWLRDSVQSQSISGNERDLNYVHF